MSRRLRHAIVGCGRVAPFHAEAFARLQAVELAFACDSEETRAAELAAVYGIAATCRSLEEVLAEASVDSVSLCTPHDLHAPMARAAVRAGKHVLVEKPFALDLEAGRGVMAAARAAGVVIMPVAQHRFDPLVREVRELIAGGDLGAVILVRAHLDCVRDKAYYRDSLWRGSWAREGGSVLMNQAHHLVDLVGWLTGPVRRAGGAIATLANAEAMETEDLVCAGLELAGGAQAALTVNGAAGPEWSSLIEIQGTGGVVAFDINYPNGLHRLRLDNRRAMQHWRKRCRACQQGELSAALSRRAYYGASHRDQARAFAEAAAGRAVAAGCSTAGEALAALATIRTVYAAAAEGRRLDVPDLGDATPQAASHGPVA